MFKFSNTDIKPLEPLLNYRTAIAIAVSTVGFPSGRCLGARLQMCALKLSLGLVVRIFVHLSSNSEINMFIVSIYNYILHIIYQISTYLEMTVDCTMTPAAHYILV